MQNLEFVNLKCVTYVQPICVPVRLQKHDPVDPVTEDYEVTLQYWMDILKGCSMIF